MKICLMSYDRFAVIIVMLYLFSVNTALLLVIYQFLPFRVNEASGAAILALHQSTTAESGHVSMRLRFMRSIPIGVVWISSKRFCISSGIVAPC